MSEHVSNAYNLPNPTADLAIATLREAIDDVHRLEKERDEKAKYLERLRIEIVGSLTAAGIYMLVDADPTAYGEVRSAVKRLAVERDEAKDVSMQLAHILSKIIGRQYVKQCDDEEAIPLLQKMGLWLDEEAAE